MSKATVNNTAKPQKWWEVYRNDVECRLFKEFSRGANEWRTADGISKMTKIPIQQVELFIKRYHGQGLIQQHSKEPQKWRYWERATKSKKKKGSISSEDKKSRIDEKLKSKSNMP